MVNFNPIRHDTPSMMPKLKLFIVMGVSGSGKTAIGQQLAKELSKQQSFDFLDADDFHTVEAKQRMAANLPLNDAMRKPWITALTNQLNQLNTQRKNIVLAYSGLKHQHRSCFKALGFDCHFYYLLADFAAIKSRMLNRKAHFFKVELLASQFNAMQDIMPDEHYITTIDANRSLDEVYQSVLILAQQVLSEAL